MNRRGYGMGRGATARAKSIRANRRTAVRIRSAVVVSDDAAAELAELLEHESGAEVLFRRKAHQWLIQRS